jgi:hypothetical protein
MVARGGIEPSSLRSRSCRMVCICASMKSNSTSPKKLPLASCISPPVWGVGAVSGVTSMSIGASTRGRSICACHS